MEPLATVLGNQITVILTKSLPQRRDILVNPGLRRGWLKGFGNGTTDFLQLSRHSG
jgi:hypothetical protein